jgi:transposase
MTKINLQQKDYTQGRWGYQLFLPVDYEVIIPTDDSVRLLNRIVEGMDIRELEASYSQIGRKPAAPPEILLKILFYAYMEEKYASRKIQKSCERDINFMWLLEGNPAPSHKTINEFRKHRLGEVVEKLFYQFVEILYRFGEISLENIFPDGTKIEANANRYTFVWKKAVERYSARLPEKARLIATEMEKLYLRPFPVRDETFDYDVYAMLKFLKAETEAKGIKIVNGPGKKQSNEQKLMKSLEELRQKHLEYENKKEILDGRGSYSKTDNDATFMRMKDDHMKNGQLKPAYNVQLAVESEYIVGAGVFQNCNDLGTLIPLIESMFENCPLIAEHLKKVIADSGYESEEIYAFLKKLGIEAYIKPQNYEQMQTRKFKNNISKRENMVYNAETDEYTCANGKQLRVVGTSKRKSKTGYESEVAVYECESCEDCPHKEKCTKAKGNRKMEVSKKFIEMRAESLENVTSDYGKLLRVNRSIQVEGAFGIIKEDRHFDQFLTRGLPNVKTELFLLCIGYNMNKLHAKIQNNRIGCILHPLKEETKVA